MSTTKTDDQTNKYDPGSMNAFQGLTSGFGKTTGDYMTNPFGNPFMQQQQQMGTRQAQNQGQTQMSNISRNAVGSGMGGGNMSPAMLEMMQNQGRSNSGMQANLGFMQPMQQAQGMQQNAMQMAGNYKPLQTGGHQTESTGGLGTWLPQLIGAGMGMAGGMMGGGGGGFFSGAGAHPGGFQHNMGTYGGMGGGAPEMGNPSWLAGMAPGMGSPQPGGNFWGGS